MGMTLYHHRSIAVEAVVGPDHVNSSEKSSYPCRNLNLFRVTLQRNVHLRANTFVPPPIVQLASLGTPALPTRVFPFVVPSLPSSLSSLQHAPPRFSRASVQCICRSYGCLFFCCSRDREFGELLQVL